MGLLNYPGIQPTYPQAFGLAPRAPMSMGAGGGMPPMMPLPTGQPQGQAPGLLNQMGPQGLQSLLSGFKGQQGAGLLGNGNGSPWNFWASPLGGGLDRLSGLFGGSGVNAPNYLSSIGAGLGSFGGAVN